jgi:hypothetical protein
MQSQAKNTGPIEKTAEQRAADRKAMQANLAAFVCTYCRQTFANTAKVRRAARRTTRPRC